MNLLRRQKESALVMLMVLCFLEESKMTPVVYVESTTSMVWESSCGSGSMGAAVYLSKDADTGEFVYEASSAGRHDRSLCKKREWQGTFL